MAKKRTQDPGNVDIFAGLGEDRVSEGADEGEKGGKGTDVAALEARINSMQAELARLERTNAALMAAPGTFMPQGGDRQAPDEPALDLEGLPDMTIDPEGYHKAVTKRISDNLRASLAQEREQERAQQSEQQALGAKVEALWSDFEEKYPDLAEHKDMVELAATSVAQKAAVKGLDVQRYMFGASEQYLADVAGEMKKRFGKALEAMGKDDPAGDGEDGKGGDEEVPAHIKEANRAMGLHGGIPTTGSGPKGAPKGEKSDLVQEIQHIQRGLGLY